MNLDVVVAILTGVLAVCAFSIHILSSPGSKNWMTLPQHIRWGLAVTGTLFMIRSVNLFTLAGRPDMALGHANPEAMAVAIALAYTVVSFTIYAAAQRLPAHAWDRLRYALRSMRHDANVVPVMMTSADVIEISQASGQPSVAGENPHGVIREAQRAQRMASRR